MRVKNLCFTCFFGILLSSLFLISSCSAKIPFDRIALGGIKVGTTMDDVKNAYGEPDREDACYSISEYIFRHYYGSSLRIEYNVLSKVITIHSTSNNGLATPDGVEVGMDASVLEDVYGPPDRFNASNEIREYNPIEYPEEVGMQFAIKDGKISEICIAYYR